MKSKWVLMAAMAAVFSGCATLNQGSTMDPDQTSQAFFDDLQKPDNDAAYGLLAKGISQRISFDQFDQFMQTLREQWGRIDSDDTETLPFHRRIGEDEFIPLGIPPDKIKRYTFDVKYEDAEMNFDLTLAPQDSTYKIVWFSVWGSSIYMTATVQKKIEELFSGPDDSSQSGQ